MKMWVLLLFFVFGLEIIGAVLYLGTTRTKKIKELPSKSQQAEATSFILSPGFELFNPETQAEYGYGRYLNVVTSLEFERILSASGPYRGKILRPSDGRVPGKIAFIQCIGSREKERNYCSSVCCMYATKHTVIAKEHDPGVECRVFYIDLRAFGKGFDAYYERAREMGVKHTRCRPSSIKEIPGSRNLELRYRSDEGNPLRKSHENPDIQRIYQDFLVKPLGERSHHLLHTHYKSRTRV